MKSPYQVLGVSSSTPKEEIRKVYRKLCRKYHPDNGGDANKFDEVNKAWESIENGTFDISKVVSRQGNLTHVSLFNFKLV